MTRKPTTTYVTASPQTWELIRAAYLSGLSAPTVAARFGVSVTALRKRAARQGWTKQAYARAHAPVPAGAPAPPPASAREPLMAAIDSIVERHMVPLNLRPGQVARRALALAGRAVAEGRALDAERLARTARTIAALDGALPYGGWDDDDDDPDADPDGRGAYLRAMAVTIAYNLAERMVAGLPLPPDFEAVRRERGERGGARGETWETFEAEEPPT